MKTESPFLRRMVGILLSLLLLLALASFVFRSEISEAISDSFSNNALAEKRVIDDSQLDAVGSYVLRPDRNDVGLIQISRLTTGGATMAGTPIAFTLTNRGESNGFPNILVVLVDKTGRAVRQQIFTEREYVHPARFEEVEVELLLSLQSGETGFTAKPFYAEKQ